ncbi:MAG: cytochrome P450 [Egibacteraceae bacterium]
MDSTVQQGREAPLVDIDTGRRMVDRLPELLTLADISPVVRVAFPGGHVWIVCDPDLVRDVLLDARFSKQPEHAPKWLEDPLIATHRATGISSLLISEGAEHLRLRRLHDAVFSMRKIRAREPAIAALMQDTLASIGHTEEVDLVEAIAYPFPVAVISEVLGLPQDVRATMRAASEDVFFGKTPEITKRGVRTLFSTIGNLIQNEPHRLLPGMIAELMEVVKDDPTSISQAEVVFWMSGLFASGHESTASLLASALYHALCLPSAQRPRTREQITAFIEETLRHDPPFPLSTYRFTNCEIFLKGVRIPAHAPVLVNLAAANHDQQTIPQPDAFDPLREDTRHVSFGWGPHLCIGASLARLEGLVMLESFVSRYPEASLVEAEASVWHGDVVTVRRLPHLRARLHA